MMPTNDNSTPVPVAAQRVKVRQFSPCGPCLTLGMFVRSTARFHVFTVWRGGSEFSSKEKRIACDSVHLEACPSCADHARTMYPHGYMD